MIPLSPHLSKISFDPAFTTLSQDIIWSRFHHIIIPRYHLIPLSRHPPMVCKLSSNKLIILFHFVRKMTFRKCQVYFKPHCLLISGRTRYDVIIQKCSFATETLWSEKQIRLMSQNIFIFLGKMLTLVLQRLIILELSWGPTLASHSKFFYPNKITFQYWWYFFSKVSNTMQYNWILEVMTLLWRHALDVWRDWWRDSNIEENSNCTMITNILECCLFQEHGSVAGHRETRV